MECHASKKHSVKKTKGLLNLQVFKGRSLSNFAFYNNTMISQKHVPLTITKVTVRERPQTSTQILQSPYNSQLEANMLASAAALFECSMLFVATLTALLSILSPNLRSGLYSVLVLLPISLMISRTEAASDDLDD
uniref:Transmembrane protein n=1 Tax=Bursaphelenchus xylophilus TaxID=6326 RepID=A0A1I7SW60_BURXY